METNAKCIGSPLRSLVRTCLCNLYNVFVEESFILLLVCSFAWPPAILLSPYHVDFCVRSHPGAKTWWEEVLVDIVLPHMSFSKLHDPGRTNVGVSTAGHPSGFDGLDVDTDGVVVGNVVVLVVVLWVVVDGITQCFFSKSNK